MSSDDEVLYTKWYIELIEVIYGERPEGENERPDPREVVRTLYRALEVAKHDLHKGAGDAEAWNRSYNIERARVKELEIYRHVCNKTIEDDKKYQEQLERRILELEFDLRDQKAGRDSACRTIALMHEAATGMMGNAPRLGVVEDVQELRLRAERAEARVKDLLNGELTP
jgi:hypothetical protein